MGMKDPNSKEAIAERANQEDPIVMYLIVRESLNMSIGKTAAQVGHAVNILCDKYTKYAVNCAIDGDNDCSVLSFAESDIYEEWKANSYRKVSLVADEKEWRKLKEEFGKSMALVIDAGLTELEPNTETVIGLWPMKKSSRSKLIKRLQVLK
jgi:PTH2 family peptidyl-tRNA hydrolase